MKKRILSLVLALVMLASMTTVAFAWIIENASADQATYYASGALKSLRVNFTWAVGGVGGSGNGEGVCMVLMTKELASGEYTDAGSICKADKYEKFEDAKADTSLGIIRGTELSAVDWNADYQWTFEFEENDIKLNEDKTYYINIWTKLHGDFYPDALGAVIRVKDGKVQFADNDGSQIEDEDFEDVPTTDSNASEQTTSDTPTVTPPASRPNYDTSEEIVWQSGAKEESKANPATSDGFNTAVSAVMALSVLAGAAVVLGKKK